MVSKFIRYVLGPILILAFLAAIVGGGIPVQVRNARDAVTLHYIDKGIYPTVSCREKRISQEYWMLCSAAGGPQSGGLYYIDYDEVSWKVYTVNGKSKSHAAGFPVSGSVTPRSGISSILSEF